MEPAKVVYTSKQYRMRRTGHDGATIVITLPPAVYWRESRIRGLSVDDFIKQFCVVANFGYFESEELGQSQGVYYTFEPIRNMSRAEAMEDDFQRLDKITAFITAKATEFKARKVQEVANVTT